MRRTIGILAVTAALAFAGSAHAALANPTSALRWRMIGPFRGGRTVAVSGVIGQPGTYYIAGVDGGVWKSTDYARTYVPIFDGHDTGSIGALAIAPSDPNVIYVGSGEGLRRPDLSVGDGIYKSTNAGRSWTHLGLRDGQQIAGLAVDPRDSKRVFAAVLGHPYGANSQRGLYRSTDGGATWTRVLGSDPDTGAVAVAIDPRHPDVVYADLWASRNPPWRLRDVLQLWAKDGLYKSVDGGTTWTQLKDGLPPRLGRIGIAIAPSDSNRLYAWVNYANGCGIYRSSNAGASWSKANGDERVCGRGDDFSGIAVDPVDENVVYAANTQTYRSRDGGTTWHGLKGAPGGDDYHTIWIDPNNRNIVFLGSDQGATLSVNYGQTWSSWYNQPTAEFYHVITDNRFPYWVYGGQQESGSAEVASRSDDGAIWIRYWHPVGAQEYAYIAPDPLHPHIIYGAGAGVVSRYDETLQQTQDVSPSYDRRAYRYNRTTPLIFSPVDKRTLYLGSNVVFATVNGGHSWRTISPDLTRPDPGIPPNLGPFAQTALARGAHRGVIYSLGPSPLDRSILWAGTDDGLVWVTRDGGAHWANVSPPLTPWSKISQIDASHFDRGAAYVAVTRLRLDDLRPYIYRTHDFGKHWQLVVSGLPAGAPVDTVREDPVRRGLLFAGTERTVYYSADDGAHWSSLQRNLPSTSIRDLVVHGNDVVVGTHGRSFWILDDIEPLRELPRAQPALASRAAYLFAPADAFRLRRDTWTDTPLPPEEPAGQNPPDGALIDYYLARSAGPVKIAIYAPGGALVRSWSSSDRPQPIDPQLTVPRYWLQPQEIPPASAGMHRFVWNYRGPDPQSVFHDYPISAIVHNTPRTPHGVLALPGTYTVRLTAAGRTYARAFKLRMDPRVHLTAGALREQFALASRIVALMNESYARMSAASAKHDAAGAQRYGGDNAQLAQLLDVVEGADAQPTVQARQAVDAVDRDLRGTR